MSVLIGVRRQYYKEYLVSSLFYMIFYGRLTSRRGIEAVTTSNCVGKEKEVFAQLLDKSSLLGSRIKWQELSWISFIQKKENCAHFLVRKCKSSYDNTHDGHQPLLDRWWTPAPAHSRYLFIHAVFLLLLCYFLLMLLVFYSYFFSLQCQCFKKERRKMVFKLIIIVCFDSFY